MTPTQTSRTFMGKPPQIFHRFALFDPPEMGIIYKPLTKRRIFEVHPWWVLTSDLHVHPKKRHDSMSGVNPRLQYPSTTNTPNKLTAGGYPKRWGLEKGTVPLKNGVIFGIYFRFLQCNTSDLNQKCIICE